MQHQFTKVPNEIFDSLLPYLPHTELKVLLVIIRQTNGWVVAKDSKVRRQRARILIAKFISVTGLSRGSIHRAISELHTKRLITIRDYNSNILLTPAERRGKTYLFYSYNPEHVSILIQQKKLVSEIEQRCVTADTELVSQVIHNKRKNKKIKTSSAFEECKAFVKELKKRRG